LEKGREAEKLGITDTGFTMAVFSRGDLMKQEKC
jgi:hypothetical protein